MKYYLIWLLIFGLFACQKEMQELPRETVAPVFKQYIIKAGEHFSNDNDLTPFQGKELVFDVRFDNSAIYSTRSPANQDDVNKLYGFADNDKHHQLYSARFGWLYRNGQLSLHAYVYNEGQRQVQFISNIEIGKTYYCSIKVVADKYLFTLNGSTTEMIRRATTPVAKGYKLFPYFGGDETAPHEIRIWLRER
jgi:hypothetical protein